MCLLTIWLYVLAPLFDTKQLESDWYAESLDATLGFNMIVYSLWAYGSEGLKWRLVLLVLC